MSRLAPGAALGYSTAVLVAVVAPAVVIASAGGRGGLQGPADVELIGPSVAVGLPAAALAWRRVRRRDAGRPRADVWIAALMSFGVLAATATAVPTLVLHATIGLPALDADAGWRVPLVWAGSQAVAVAAGEGTHRLGLRWLSR